jgi:chromosome segregation ATPase
VALPSADAGPSPTSSGQLDEQTALPSNPSTSDSSSFKAEQDPQNTSSTSTIRLDQQQINLLKNQLADRDSEILALGADLARSREETSTARKVAVQDLAESEKKWQARYEQLSRDLAIEQAENKRLREEVLGAAAKESRENLARISELESSLQRATEHREQSERALPDRTNELEGRVNDLRRELEMEKQTITVQTAVISAGVSEVANAGAEIARLRTAVGRLEDEQHLAESKLRTAEVEAAEARGALAASIDENKVLRKQSADQMHLAHELINAQKQKIGELKAKVDTLTLSKLF